MDKKTIKNFAVESRNKLREDVKYQLNLIGIINETEILNPHQKDSDREIYDVGGFNPKILYKNQIKQRNSLINVIKEKGYDNVVEEVAYTWFNRIIAIRFMEVNNYLPTKIRVLSSEIKNKIEPDMVTEAPNINLNFDESEVDIIYSLKNENKLDELFQFLFIKQCNELNKILPELFEETEDYLELLLSISFTKEEGIIRELINSISEEDFKNQVEIIGWLYQYYNSELKDHTLAQLKKRVKITKERIPAATQLFTPDWIVKYMVENSLGKLWLEGHPDDNLKENWKYYLDEAKQDSEIQPKLDELKNELKNVELEEIKIIDPCMGSGHILIYVFDVLMQIYLSQGYNKKDAVVSILKNNIYGLDIDDRAYQLAYFAILMKARSFHRQIFNENIELNLASIQESNHISSELIEYLSNNNPDLKENFEYIKEVFTDAKEFGSLVSIKKLSYGKLKDIILQTKPHHTLKESKFLNISENKIVPLLKQTKILSQKYDIVVTNPPYMSSSGMNKKLIEYLKKFFFDAKKDFFAAFIEKSFSLCKNEGHVALLTPYVWMFLQSFLKLRENIIENKTITTLTQLEYNAFPEACVPVCVFTFKNKKTNDSGEYIRLSEFKGVDIQEPKTLEAINNPNCGYRFTANQNEFFNIPGTPIAYWAGTEIINVFKNGKKLSTFADVKQGLATADNNRFLRLWYEVDINNIGLEMENFTQAKKSGKKWFPYNKGGSFRKWYGNQEYVINYENDGEELKNFKQSVLRNTNFYFKEGITWSNVSSSYFGVRYIPSGMIFDTTGPTLFISKSETCYLIGLLCSKISTIIMNILNPTLHYNVGDVANIPIFFSQEKKERVNLLVKKNISLSKDEWNDFETSWNFIKHPLCGNSPTLVECFEDWEILALTRFNEIKSNEEKLNKIFLNIYHLNNVINYELEDNDLTINKANLKINIKSLISYFIGCLFGRYSLDQEGLIYAGGEWNPSKYSKFIPNEDNIIPILDAEYFSDDIVKSFESFLKVVYGKKTLEENIKFVSNSLGNKGTTYRDTIRKYFIKDFFNDHKKMYKKTPIYWQFDSGKADGFKALIYMHRYTPDTIAKVRTDYLHRLQKALEESLSNNEQIIANTSNVKEKNKATKENVKLKKQLDETRKYDEALGHIANQQIEIDLDDGVKVNYAKFQEVKIGNKKIDLLKKL